MFEIPLPRSKFLDAIHWPKDTPGKCFIYSYESDEDLEEYSVRLNLAANPVLLENVILQLIKGVAFMHRAGIIHNDLKPANIMVQSDPRNLSGPRIRIIDFDLATRRTPLADNDSGTWPFQPPEV